MPDLGEGVAEGEIVRWLVAPGQEVAEDDLLVEIQTDKATVELEAFRSGFVRGFLVRAGETVPIGTPVALVADSISPSPRPHRPTGSAPYRGFKSSPSTDAPRTWP